MRQLSFPLRRFSEPVKPACASHRDTGTYKGRLYIWVWHNSNDDQRTLEVHFLLWSYFTCVQRSIYRSEKHTLPLLYADDLRLALLHCHYISNFNSFESTLKNRITKQRHRKTWNYFTYVSLMIFCMSKGLTSTNFWWQCPLTHEVPRWRIHSL
jgi:hypothetical protein